MKPTYFCKQCGGLAYMQIDNRTYCEKCGHGVPVMPVPDESTAYGNDCPNGRCEP